MGIKVEVWTKLSDARELEFLALVSWLTVRNITFVDYTAIKPVIQFSCSVKVFQSFINLIPFKTAVSLVMK